MKISLFKDKNTMVLLFLTILWMSVIFCFSAQPAVESSKMSGFVKDSIDKVFNILFQGNIPGILSEGSFFSEYLIRKLGHVTEFFILGILTALLSGKLFSKKAFLKALILCALYASSDEFHQIFVSGRGPMVTDVLLDTAASFIGILIINIKSLRLHTRKSL